MVDQYSSIPKRQETVDALWRLQKIILDTLDFNEVVQRIVNSILTELGYLHLGYRILVLTLVDEKHNILKRIALSQTQEAQGALNASPIPFEKIAIPLNADSNLLIKSLKEQKPYVTHSWPDIFRPILTDAEALHNQASAGIKTSMIYPLVVKDQSIGVMIFSMIKSDRDVTEEEKDLIARFTDIVGLAVQNAQLYSSVQETSEKLKLANIQLKELDKLKDEFVSLASHELRTPMTAIKSYIWLLLQQSKEVGTLNAKQKQYLERTYASTERLIKLVNDMLNVSRIQSGRMSVTPKPTDLAKLIQDTILEVAPAAQEHQVKIIFTPPTQALPPVSADPEKIKEVIINLIGNSLKFTPANGTISVSVYPKDTMLITQVTDTGKGIKPEDIHNLFQKFGIIESNYLSKENMHGTGLGLYISKSIVELHGGKMWVESKGENQGTTFYFSLKPVV